MEMPELFGTDYLLPAIIIVVLLIALLVLLASRRRGAAPKAKKSAKGKMAEEATVAAASAEPLEASASAPTPQPAVARRPSPGGPSVKGSRPATTGAPDPLELVLMDLLHGWGDLTVDDTKRLELFRPEKVVAAIAAIELPKSKSSDDARTRLTQLRQYAGDLQRRQKVPASQAEVAPTSGDGPGPIEPATAAATPVAGVAAPAGAAAAVAKSAGPEATWYAPVAPEPSAAPAPSVAPPLQSMTPGMPVVSSPLAAAATVAAATVAEQASTKKDLADVESFWAEPAPEWQPAPEAGEMVFEEAVPPAYSEIAPRIEAEAAAAAAVTPAFPAAEALAGAVSDGLDPLSRLRVRIQNAADLLALPPEEQTDMVAFLEPHDLSAVFRATRNTEVKLAVIDTLANIGSPASLSALGSCLDDPNRDIQLYALDAADRLLRTND